MNWMEITAALIAVGLVSFLFGWHIGWRDGMHDANRPRSPWQAKRIVDHQSTDAMTNHGRELWIAAPSDEIAAEVLIMALKSKPE